MCPWMYVTLYLSYKVMCMYVYYMKLPNNLMLQFLTKGDVQKHFQHFSSYKLIFVTFLIVTSTSSNLHLYNIGKGLHQSFIIINSFLYINHLIIMTGKITLTLLLAESRPTYHSVFICTWVLIFSVKKNNRIKAQAIRIFMNCVIWKLVQKCHAILREFSSITHGVKSLMRSNWYDSILIRNYFTELLNFVSIDCL